MIKQPKIVVVLPAYNAEKTIVKTIKDIPEGAADEIICVDDCSSDNTVEIAKGLGAFVIRHEKNMGYGGNQKTCYQTALNHSADIVVMLHPDYQYDPKLLPHLVSYIRDDYFDIMLGSRIRTRKETLENGMPLYKYIGNRFLTLIENVITGQALREWHTGYRAYSKKVLDRIPWINDSDDFVFDQEFLIQASHFGFRIGEVPVPVRYLSEASTIDFRRSLKYGIDTLIVLIKYILHKSRIVRDKRFN